MNPKYIPKTLSHSDKEKQERSLKKSKKDYKKGIYYIRPKIKGFKNRRSGHVERAKKRFNVTEIGATQELSRKSGCPKKTLKKIINKGKGAYFSSGSRPNQTPNSWGNARLASALTGGPASKTDNKELKECKKSQRKPVKKMKKKMKEKIEKIEKGKFPKKYTAHVKDKVRKTIRKIHFGDQNYEQFKDRTRNGLYSKKNHGDKRRQQNYYSRHSGEKVRHVAIAKEIRKSKGYYNAKILSHQYLW